jgi:hypothetical protein
MEKPIAGCGGVPEGARRLPSEYKQGMRGCSMDCRARHNKPRDLKEALIKQEAQVVESSTLENKSVFIFLRGTALSRA